MRKYLVLFIAVFVSVKESNAATKEVVWTAGSPVHATFGPEDAVYCRLKNTANKILYDGFGQCRITLDRVTMNHQGIWEIITGKPGTIFVRSSWIRVTVLPNEPSKLVIQPSVISNQSSVNLTCSVPKGDQVKSCIFRDPSGYLFVATPELTKDAYDTDLTRYETFAENNYCRLTLLKPILEVAGYWRCAVYTTSNHGYGFLDGTRINHLNDPDDLLPSLESNDRVKMTVEGATARVSWSINDAISYCYFRAPNGTIFNINPSTSTADYEYIGNGFEAGECGMRINNIRTSAHGRWNCTVGVHRPDVGRIYEKTDEFYISVEEPLAVTQSFENNGVIVMSLRVSWLAIPNIPYLEYCRFVRSDGLSITFRDRDWYYVSMSSQNTCELNILRPVAADVGLWTVAAKVANQDEELIRTYNLEPQPWTSRSGFDTRIAGGNDANITSYPFLTGLLTNQGNGAYVQRCGGSILTNNAILSAASCFYTNGVLNPFTWWRARVGSKFANSGGTIYIINRITVHENFDLTTLVNNLAVLRTTLNINYVPNLVQPARIAGTAYPYSDRQHVFAVGWGATSSDGSTERLQMADVWLINQQTCVNRYSQKQPPFTVTDDMICAGFLDVGERGQCDGDVGSPLLDPNNAVIGVFSRAEDCGNLYYPDINTRVASYTNWIISTARAT